MQQANVRRVENEDSLTFRVVAWYTKSRGKELPRSDCSYDLTFMLALGYFTLGLVFKIGRAIVLFPPIRLMTSPVWVPSYAWYSRCKRDNASLDLVGSILIGLMGGFVSGIALIPEAEGENAFIWLGSALLISMLILLPIYWVVADHMKYIKSAIAVGNEAADAVGLKSLARLAWNVGSMGVVATVRGGVRGAKALKSRFCHEVDYGFDTSAYEPQH